MTMAEIKASRELFLTPVEIAGVLGCNPYSINVQAREDISKLGFPASMIGSRVRIPRKAFLKFMGEEVDEE